MLQEGITRQGISRISVVNSMQEPVKDQPIGSISDRGVTKTLPNLKRRYYYNYNCRIT